MDSKKLDPATKFVRSLSGDYYLLREAAVALGVSPRVLRHYIKRGETSLGPSYAANMGKVRIYLYTAEDVERIREKLQSRSVVYRNEGRVAMGRPAIFTPEQRLERQRKFSMANYYRKRYTKLTDAGHVEKAEVALRKARQLEEELKR